MTLLDWLVALPAIGALAVPLIAVPREQAWVVRAFGVVMAVVELGVSVLLVLRFHVGRPGFQDTQNLHWIGIFGVHWYLGADGISLVLVLMTAVLFVIAMAAIRGVEDLRSYVGWMLLLEAACMGSFVSLDLLLFFIFFELSLVPVYFLIADFGFVGSGRAAVKFFVYTFAGSALLLVGIITLVVAHDHQTGQLTFAFPALEHTRLGATSALLLFLAFTAAFAVKTPVFPFHTWSPDTYQKAPIAAVVIVAGVMAKLGSYGILRFDLGLFPGTSRQLAWLMLTLAVAGILWGAIVAAGERHLGRLVAYSSLSHMGFIVLGIFAFSTEGLSGSVLQMVNHGIYTAAMFLLLGMIYDRSGTLDMQRLGGIQRTAPVLAAIFTVVIMAQAGLPGLNGFVGEFLILVGTFVTHRWWAVVAVAGIVGSAAYLLWAYQRVFHRSPAEARSVPDLRWGEVALVAPLIALIVVLGVYPRPLLSAINPSTSAIVAQARRAPLPSSTPTSTLSTLAEVRP
jgi:NADH-quinone oxidoreductase subunit M